MLSALVLTAGLGTRLDPLTRLVAKPAVPMGDRTLIERVLGWLRREGVTDVVLNLHHRPESITAIVGDGAHLGLRARYSWERQILGSAGGPRRALQLLDGDPFLIVNGDTICPIALSPMIDAHTRTGAAVTLALVPNPAPDQYNGVVLDKDDRVCAFVPKGPEAAGSWHFVGVQITNASVFATLTDGVPAETVSGLYRDRLVASFGSVRGWRVHEPFTDVGTPRDYLRACTTPGVADSVIWPGARVAAGVELQDCVVAGPVTLPSGFTARRVVLVPASVVRPGEAVQIVGDVAVFPI